MTLRYYQQACLNAIKQKEFKRGLCILPTGAGKSHIIAQLKGVCVAPRLEIVNQNIEKGSNCITINKAYRTKIAGTTLIIDEAHLVNEWGGMYADVMSRFKKVIGFTATPYRLDSGHLYPSPFDSILYEITREELIKGDFLCDRKRFQIPFSTIINLDSKFFRTLTDTSDAVCPQTEKCLTHFFDRWDGKSKTIIFACDLNHADKIKQIISYDCEIVSSKLKRIERHRIINDFKDPNGLKIIINCELLTCGFDCPSLRNVVLLRPTQSYSLYEQMCGRGDRMYEGKKFNNIWDYTLNTFNFEGSRKSAGKINYERLCVFCGKTTDYRMKNCKHCDEILIKGEMPNYKCSHCEAVNHPRATYCRKCNQFIKKNVHHIYGLTQDIEVSINKTTRRYSLKFGKIKIHHQSKETAQYVVSKKNKHTTFELIYKYRYDYFTKQKKLILVSLEFDKYDSYAKLPLQNLKL